MSAPTAPGGRTIAIYGAGTLGRRVAALLADGGHDVALVGRDRARLDAVAAELDVAAVRVAPIHDRAALAAAFADAAVVIGCAGPYARVGAPIAAAALAAGAHYLDAAAEPAFVRALYEEHESAARRAGRCLVSGLGAIGGLGDWAAHWAASALTAGDPPGRGRLGEGDPLDAITIAYTFDGARPTAGLARSLLAALTEPTVTWRAGRWDEIQAGVRGRDVDFGALGRRRARELPTIESITVPRHVAAHRVETFVAPTGSPWVDRAIGAAAPLLRWLPGLAATVDALADQGPHRDDADDAEARFAIVAEARRGTAHTRVALTGRDLYATAAAVCAQLARALAAGALGGAGVLAPSQLIAGERALGVMELVVTTDF